MQFQANSNQTTVDTSMAVAWREAPGNEYVSRYWAAQNYPNPFSPRSALGRNTTIRYTIPAGLPNGNARVELKIYNLLGQVMKTLVIKEQAPGEYTVVWDGTDEAGGLVAAGIYLVRSVAGDFVAERKVVVLR